MLSHLLAPLPWPWALLRHCCHCQAMPLARKATTSHRTTPPHTHTHPTTLTKNKRALFPTCQPPVWLCSTLPSKALVTLVQDAGMGPTQESLNLQRCPKVRATVPLPHPSREAQYLITKLCNEDDIEAYLQTFKCIVLCEKWEEETWAQILMPYLLREAKRAYYALPADEATNYRTLKVEIPARCSLCPNNAEA